MSDKAIDRLEFESPINLEGSWGQRNLAAKTKSTMGLYFNKDGSAYIEWDIPDLEITESIGCTFEFGPDDKRTLVDYDGVFSIPDEAMDLLERNGIDCAEMRKTMAS